LTERILKERTTYTKRQISFPSAHNILPGQHDILIDYYDLKGDGKKPVILVLPILGGDIPYLLTYSNEPGIARRRAEYLSEHQLTLADLQAELTRKITCDPLHFAEYIDAGKVLMVLALFDETVPFEKGRELKEKMGDPATIYLFSGHYTSILFKNYIKYKSRKFFERTFPKR
jgi:hypothetical protein